MCVYGVLTFGKQGYLTPTTVGGAAVCEVEGPGRWGCTDFRSKKREELYLDKRDTL
jgi:hypothetical protein